MHIGPPVRELTVEPVVSPVPDGDHPGRPAALRPAPTVPTPRTGARREPRVPTPA